MTKETIQQIKQRLQHELTEEELTRYRTDSRKGVQQALRTYDRRIAKEQEAYAQFQRKCAFDDAYGTRVAGVDEAGRGPLAGPVVTAAVILDPASREALVQVDDSKALSKEVRTRLAELIKEHALDYTIDFSTREQIDELNIYRATSDSMTRSIQQLNIKPDYVLTDAMPLQQVEVPTTPIIKGDAQSLAIAAASILAKTARDAYMDELDERYPVYGFAQHAGYGTAQHLTAIREYGIIDEHRRTFEPIRSMMK